MKKVLLALALAAGATTVGVLATQPECAWKLAPEAVCQRVFHLLPDGGEPGHRPGVIFNPDPGLKNIMAPGDWVGSGCVRVECEK